MANNVNREDVVKNAMSRAAKLMQLESNGTIDKIASDPNFKTNINNSLENGDILTEQLMTTSVDRRSQAPMVGMPMGDNAMNVPAAIRESFASMPIDDSDLYAAFGEQGDGRSLSFLNEMVAPKPQPQIAQPMQNVRQIVNEGMSVQQPQISQQIDYPLIKTIVEDIVKKYAVSLNKKIISEGKQSQAINQVNTIALGETFKFLTKNGDIYECTMRKISNIKEAKNKRGIVK